MNWFFYSVFIKKTVKYSIFFGHHSLYQITAEKTFAER